MIQRASCTAATNSKTSASFLRFAPPIDGPVRFWIADSSAESLLSWKCALSTAGIERETLLFESGLKLLEAARYSAPEYLLLDTRLSIVTGPSILKALRQDVRFARTRIYMLSSPELPCFAIEAMAWGATGELAKPVGEEDYRFIALALRNQPRGEQFSKLDLLCAAA